MTRVIPMTHGPCGGRRGRLYSDLLMADTPLPRRGFFKQSLAELMKPLGHALRPARQIMDELNKLEGFVMDADPTPAGPVKHWLRPPGSVEEEQFRNQCSRSGECVRVC